MSLEKQQFAFGDFVLDANERVLLQAGIPVSITPKVLQLLFVLIENHGHIVEKATLMDLVWPDSFVEESNLTFTMRQLRKALGDNTHEPRFIETVPRRGYRFVADVRLIPETGNGNRTAANLADSAGKEMLLSHELRSRPVLVFLLAIVAIAAVVSAGFLIWRERPAGVEPAAVAADAALKFATIVSSDLPITTAISADGKYIAYSNTVNGQQSLWLRQLSSGTNTQLLAPNDGTIFSHLEFSSDGEYIYFTDRYKDQPPHLDRISILGGVVKANLLTGLDGAFSLSPDDRLISFRRYELQKRSLLVADIDGTEARLIYETSKTFTDNVFSPDGTMIAFASGESDTGSRDYGVYTIDIATGTVRPATEHKWFHVRSLVWLPDQSALLVTARMKNDEPHQIWRISLVSGDVKQVTDTQDDLVTLATSGDLTQTVVTQLSLSSNLYLASLSQPSDARPISSAYSGVAWTPSGELVYSAHSTGNADIWMVNAK
ncbi:MAG TPA: winged helix-turn-helix domain-containing protein, partial [Pyrinomonadaceae bacterium]|nr:winged helix-turn-helix domain-containing protein [Pyrinomonadaceae bacterium]